MTVIERGRILEIHNKNLFQRHIKSEIGRRKTVIESALFANLCSNNFSSIIALLRVIAWTEGQSERQSEGQSTTIYIQRALTGVCRSMLGCTDRGV